MARNTVGTVKGGLRDVQRDMGKALGNYADELIEVSSERPLEYREWLAAFLGKSYFAPDERPRLVQQAANAMRIRHALGEPVIGFDGVHLSLLAHLVTRPDDYNPEKPETFFTFGLQKIGSRYLGNISCRIVESLGGRGTEKMLRHSTMNILNVSRITSGLSLETLPLLYTDGSPGMVYGLPAIREAGSEYFDANHVVLAGIEGAVSRMRDFAGEKAKMPSLAR